MELWLRHKKAKNLEFDERIFITSQREWHEIIYNPELISSILWPDSELFSIQSKHTKRKHYHEVDYVNGSERNMSFLNGCRNIASRLNMELSGSRCLVYAPLRGALPIWRGISQFLKNITVQTYFPVTSSFISFPEEFGILGKRNRTASGRWNNRFELERIRPFLEAYDYLLYVDEIISGGMMRGHLKDMFRVNLQNEIPIIAVGLADRFGQRSKSARLKFEEYVEKGKLNLFVWEGCDSLITEDQKFLLGAHYVDYQLGPHIVPLLDHNLQFYEEKREFDKSVFAFFTEQDIPPDRFSAAR